MPEIKEYAQRVGTPSGISDFTVNPSNEGAAGRGIQRAGAAISDVGNLLLDVQQAKETSEGSKAISELQLKYTKRLMDEVNTGQLSLDKLQEDFDNELQAAGANFITRGASDYFSRSGQQLKNSLSMDALKAQAEITSVKIKSNVTQALDNAQQTLAINPYKFADVKKQYEQDVRSLTIDGKLIDAKLAEKMIAEGSKQLDVAQFRGLIYNTDTKNLPQLKKSLEAGMFQDRQFADEDFKRLRTEIDTEYRGRISAEKDRLQLQKEQRDAAKDAEKNKFLLDKVGGPRKYTPMDIARSNVLDPDEKMALITKIDSIGTRVDKNAANSILNDAYRKMLLPDGDPNKIVSQEQVLAISANLPADKANWLLGRFMASKTPQEKVNSKLKATFYDYAKKQLGIDPLSKIVDPEAEAQLSDLTNDFETQYAQKVSEGISPVELLTQSGKSSLYPLVENYRRNLNQRLASLTKGMKGGAAKEPPKREDGTKIPPKEYLNNKKEGR